MSAGKGERGRACAEPATLTLLYYIVIFSKSRCHVVYGTHHKRSVEAPYNVQRIRHYWIRYVSRKLAVYRRYSRRMDAVVLYWYYRRRRKIRRYWQHPLMAQRSREGAYSLLMSQLRGMQHPGVHLKIFITPIALVYRLLATLLKKFHDAYGTIYVKNLSIVDSDYRFVYVSVGSYGKECDSSIFKETTFWKMMIDDSLQIPAPCPLTRDSETIVPYVVIGDESFGLHENILRPFGGTYLDKNKRMFNYRLTRARRYVECAFSILADKWTIFHRPLDIDKTTAVWTVKACTILHNFIRDKKGSNSDNNVSEEFSYENLPHEIRTRGPSKGLLLLDVDQTRPHCVEVARTFSRSYVTVPRTRRPAPPQARLETAAVCVRVGDACCSISPKRFKSKFRLV
ncbi:Protein ALP1-like [Eumeta japonica]|uniref:Protein ALP1-like n=1 Tax=Eumeta variegata TaxID=151549 RepID=A0A4C1YUN7_EUMVA|nr:Protein ALP1-like [Eumeta japonica]